MFVFSTSLRILAILKNLTWFGPMLLKTVEELWQLISKTEETLEMNACENMNSLYDRNKNQNDFFKDGLLSQKC